MNIPFLRSASLCLAWTLLTALVALAGCTGPTPTAADPTDGRRPNVILIYADDQGTIDVGALGADDLHTPHLDELFASGVTLTSFYAPAPVCSPSRAGMLTGRVPHRAQLAGNVPRNHPTAGMPTEQVTIAEMLHDYGYATAHIGKWHLGHGESLLPNAQGFDHSFGHHGGCIDNYSHFMYWSGPNGHDLYRNGEAVHAPGRFFPDLMVEEATRWIAEQDGRPFFMYFAINLPHYPYQGEPHWLERYASEGLETPRLEYAAFISTMDDRIGALLEALERMGLADDTIVIYQSDHGHSTEERAFFGGGDAGPHRGAKFSLLEGGLHVPAAIRWPNGLPANEMRGQFATGCDWLPTIAELVGCDLPDRRLDGESLVQVLRDDNASTPHAVFHWAQGDQWAVRDGDWKLIRDARDTTDGRRVTTDRGVRLYNLQADPGESNDLAGEHPERVREMTALHEQWVRERDTQ